MIYRRQLLNFLGVKLVKLTGGALKLVKLLRANSPVRRSSACQYAIQWRHRLQPTCPGPMKLLLP